MQYSCIKSLKSPWGAPCDSRRGEYNVVPCVGGTTPFLCFASLVTNRQRKANARLSICWSKTSGRVLEGVWPCSLMHCGPYEGRICLMDSRGWQHKLALPAITTFTLTSPSPSDASADYFSSLYFSSRLCPFPLLAYSSNLLPPTLFTPHRTFFVSLPLLWLPRSFTFHIPLEYCLHFISQRSINSQGGDRTWEERKLRVWHMLTNALNVHAQRTPSRHRRTHSHFPKHLN